MPQRVTRSPSRLVALAAVSASSSQVAGARSGSSPASRNASLFQYITMVERWNGTPQICPPICPLRRKAG